MSSLNFTKAELAAGIVRGVRQCVVIGSRQQPWREAFESPSEQTLQVLAVGEDPQSESPATFVPTQFASEALAMALEKSNFDKRKVSLFVWLGGAGYRTVEAALASLAFIASLPKGSGVVFNYAVERASLVCSRAGPSRGGLLRRSGPRACAFCCSRRSFSWNCSHER